MKPTGKNILEKNRRLSDISESMDFGAIIVPVDGPDDVEEDEGDTITITRADIKNILEMELVDIKHMMSDCYLLRKHYGENRSLNRVNGCLQTWKDLTEGLIDIFSTTDSDTIIGLNTIEIDPNGPKT